MGKSSRYFDAPSSSGRGRGRGGFANRGQGRVLHRRDYQKDFRRPPPPLQQQVPPPEEQQVLSEDIVAAPVMSQEVEEVVAPEVKLINVSSRPRNYRKWDNRRKKTDGPPVPIASSVPKDVLQRYSRGKGIASADNVQTKVRKTKVMEREKKIETGLERAAAFELLLTEDSGAVEVDEGEHTLQLKQVDITKKVDIASATKGFHLSLDEFGPYKLRYTSNGRFLALGGRKGHIATFDWMTKSLMCEIGVRESVHDVVWLHNENMFAVAQKEWTFIYDNQGIEIHCLKSMDRVINLDFLPYHFLLVGGHQSGYLSWVDVSIGKIVAQFNARHGPVGIMKANPSNAVLHCGHTNGTVSLWAPTVRKPLASILCHGCPLSSIEVDTTGRLMATGGRDGSLRIWDLRNSFTPLTSVKVGVPTSMSFSQRGLLAVSTGNNALVFSEIAHKQKAYLQHPANSQISCLQFCPFEDVLGVGTTRGFDSVIVPGSGEPNFDALERNPFQTKSQRREAEVKALLEKIQPELITLDNDILGQVDTETLKDTLDNKPQYVKKADIKLVHRKKRKNAKIPKIKETLRTELTLRNVKAESRKQKEKAKMTKFESDDPLSRFAKKN